MKVEVGKFYRTRDGRKTGPVKNSERYWSNNRFVFDLTPTEKCPVFRAICDASGKNPYNYDLDLIEEWKEPEVKEPKFKVGDYVTAYGWSSKTGYKIVDKTDTRYFISSSDGSYIGEYLIENWDSRLELVESAKPEITVKSRWTNIGKESKTVTVVHINDKYVTFEHDGRGTIETATYDTFYAAYKPYVEPPKSLVGYVGVWNSYSPDETFFGPICDSEAEVISQEKMPSGLVTLLSVKKIEWTDGK